MGILTEIFLEVLRASLAASILGFIVIFIRSVFRMKINPRVYCILWLVVGLKFIAGPIIPASAISFFNLIEGGKQMINSDKQAVHQNENIPFVLSFEKDNLRKSKETENAGRIKKAYNDTELSSNMIDGDLTEPKESLANKQARSPDSAFKIINIAAFVWLLGLGVIGIVFVSAKRKFVKSLKALEASEEEKFIRVIEQCMAKLNMKEDISLFVSSHIHSPCMQGILKPKIIFPQRMNKALGECEDIHIIMHELSHFKRKDNLLKGFMVIGQAIHWFNPIMWLVITKMKSDIELACDTYVLEALGEEEAVPYGMTLIKSIQFITSEQPMTGLLNFYDTKKQIERRIKMIKGFKKGNYKLPGAVIIICLAIGVTALTNAVPNTASAKENGSNIALVKSAVSNNVNMPAKDNHLNEEALKFTINPPGGKSFNSLQRAKDFIDFDFTVPDFIPSRYKFETMWFIKRKEKNEEFVNIAFRGIANPNYSWRYQISKENLLETEILDPINSHSKFQKEPMSIGEVKGTLLTITSKGYKGGSETGKHFIWQDGEIWYDIYFSYVNGNYNMSDISKEELIQIVKSMTSIGDIKNVNYVRADSEGLPIYDETDLKKAEKVLGFTPKFSLNLTGEYSIFSSSAGYEKNYGQTLSIHYLPANYLEQVKRKGDNLKKITDNMVQIKQIKNTAIYDRVNENGFVTAEIEDKMKKVEAKHMKIAGCDVYSLDGVMHNGDLYTDAGDRVFYIWKEDNVCYMMHCSKNINNKLQIIKQLVLEKTANLMN